MVPPCRPRALAAELGGTLATPNFRELPFQRLSGNSERAPLRGLTSLRNRTKGHHLDASRYRKTRDPTRAASFQTVSPRTSVYKGRGTVPPVPATEEQAYEPSHAYKPTLVFKLLPQQLYRPLSEEVECVAVGVPLTDVELRALVSYQRAFLDEVVQGALVTIRAVAYG